MRVNGSEAVAFFVGWLQMWGIIILIRFLTGTSFASKSKE